MKDEKTKDRTGKARFDEVVEVEGFSTSKKETEVDDRLTSRAINATMVLGFGTFAVTKLLTIDHDYWQVSIFNFNTHFASFHLLGSQ